MKLRLTSCTAAQIHYAAYIQRRSGTKMADTQCAVKVKSPVSINIMVCPPGCSTLLGISTISSCAAALPCPAGHLKSRRKFYMWLDATHAPSTTRQALMIFPRTRTRAHRECLWMEGMRVYSPQAVVGCHMTDWDITSRGHWMQQLVRTPGGAARLSNWGGHSESKLGIIHKTTTFPVNRHSARLLSLFFFPCIVI